MSAWPELGFRESPYMTDPVPATADGNNLFVGREAEITRLERAITSSSRHPTIEGENGVGKTSLVAVTGYRLYRNFLSTSSSQAILPVTETFQLSRDDTPTSFAQRILYSVASGFIEHSGLLKERGYNVPDTDSIRSWLSSPVIASSYGAGASVLGFGGNAQRSTSLNTTAGFTEAGFANTVLRWLRECFPERAAGGFLCVIDNLELLETGQNVRALLEAMRDSALSLPGIFWVLCGARGIVRTGAASPRLEGRLMDPLELKPMSDESVELAITRRIDAFKTHPGAIAPVSPVAFRHVYDTLNRNLRNALRYSDEFSLWLLDEAEELKSQDHLYDLICSWLAAQADKHVADTKLTPRAWQLFDDITNFGGAVSPSQYADLGFNSMPAMRPHVEKLENANLIQGSIEDSDKRRKTLTITPRGWLVRYARAGYKPPVI